MAFICERAGVCVNDIYCILVRRQIQDPVQGPEFKIKSDRIQGQKNKKMK